ncbi:MAG: hypothetical protein ACM3NR_04140 [Methanosarcina sp.]
MNDIFSVLSLTGAGEIILTVTGKNDSGNSLILAKKSGASIENMMTDVIKPVKKEIMERSGINIREVIVALSSAYISISQHRGYIVRDIIDEEINQSDLTTLMNFMLKITPPTGMGIVTIAPHLYTVDDESRILSPVGMCGKRLECTYNVMFAVTRLVDIITGGLFPEGISVKKFIPDKINAAKPFLTAEEIESLSGTED